MSAVVWLDGLLMAADQARIDPADRGFLLADGLFETIKVTGGTVWHLGRHLTRLRAGAELLGLPVPFGDAAIGDGIFGLLAANQLRDAAVRLSLSAGVGPRGLMRPSPPRPVTMLSAAELMGPLSPARLVVARSTRRNEHSPLSRIKALGYGDQILARREAAARGADDAILLNGAGEIAGASVANLLLHDGARWLTPPVAGGALPGIGRGMLIEAGLVQEQTLFPEDLNSAVQLLLINSLAEREVTEAENMVFIPRPELLAPLLRVLQP
jgi:branched-chain amino acid aminotransferase